MYRFNIEIYSFIFKIINLDLILISLEKLNPFYCIIEGQKTIIEIENVGCMVFVLKDLEYCERVVVSLNGTNLNGLQKNKILVNVHPESVKIRKVDFESSIQKGLLQKYTKHNDKDMK